MANVQLQSSLQYLEIDFTGAATTYEKMVCLNTFTDSGTTDVTEETTNCGVLTSVAAPKITITGEGVVEYTPDSGYASYSDVNTAFANRTQISVRIQNPVVTGSSLGAYNYETFQGYITQREFIADMTTYVKFSFQIQSTGTIDFVV
jgi:Flp pilus assembly protein TadG